MAGIVLVAGLIPPDVHPLASVPAILLSLLLAVELCRPRSRPQVAGWTWVPAAVAAGVALASSAMALQPLRSLRVLVLWLAGALVFLGARTAARAGGGWKTILACLVAVAAIQAGLGIWQSAVAFPAAAAPASDAVEPASSADEAHRRAAAEARIRSGRAVGLLGLPALLASMCILALPPAVAGAVLASGARRWICVAAALTLLGGLAASRSLGGVAALALSAAASFALWPGAARRRRGALAAAILLVAAAGALPRLAGGGEQAASRALALRAGNWTASLSMAAAHPAVGVGPGNYGVAYPAHRPAGSNETQHAHNSYLELVSDAGLGAALLLAVLLAGLWRVTVRASRAEAQDRWASRALAMGVLAWALQNAVDFSAYVWGSFLPFMAAAGILAAAGCGRARLRPWGPVAAGVTLLAAAAAAAFTVPDALSRHELIQAAGAAREGEREEALARARASVAWSPWNPESRAALAHALLDRVEPGAGETAGRSRAVAEALLQAREAVRLDPSTANRRMTLSRARAAAGDLAGAYAAMVQAARLNPFKAAYAARRDLLERHLLGTGESR